MISPRPYNYKENYKRDIDDFEKSLKKLPDYMTVKQRFNEGSFNIESKVSTVMKALGAQKRYEDRLDLIIKNSPDKLRGLNDLMGIIENDLLPPSTLLHLPIFTRKCRAILLQANQETIDGYDPPLYEYSTIFLETDQKTYEHSTHGGYIESMAEGIALAHFYPLLKKKIKKYSSLDTEPEKYVAINEDKIRWTGTPVEFGAIMNRLIDEGYIAPIYENRAKAQSFKRHFTIITNRKSEIKDRSFEDCFLEEKNPYFADELKIPTSENKQKKKVVRNRS